MNFNFNTNVFNSVISTFKHMIYQSYNSLQIVECSEHLSAIERKHLSASMLCTLHMSRICNVVDYLLNSEDDSREQTLESFEIENLIEEIVCRFESAVSNYSPVSIDLSTKLKDTNSILLSKSHFELVILNLLYCCVKTKPDGNPIPVKISISVTENKNDIVFHIRDNNKSLDIEEINTAFWDSASSFESIDGWSFATLIALSLRVAQKSTKEMNGSLIYTPLKHGNRYDIHLPKLVNTPTYMMCSPVPYVPTYSYYNEFFADLKLEHILRKIISCFEEETEGINL
ncbi:MAG: HAMP domain-containing histidine kinase [Clostridia bacterium]|nr:HAMP domain-containing histidine kinase [Clostridia bacterium]